LQHHSPAGVYRYEAHGRSLAAKGGHRATGHRGEASGHFFAAAGTGYRFVEPD
jgi:hypothetical protein